MWINTQMLISCCFAIMLCLGELVVSRKVFLLKDHSDDGNYSRRERVKRILTKRSYCRLQGCCPGRNDDCTVYYYARNATCYCDSFCTSDATGPVDCCPDFWTVCLQHPTQYPTPEDRGTSPLQQVGCFKDERHHGEGAILRDNCNSCKCVNNNWKCSAETCLVRPSLIKQINNGNYGWKAHNYSQFWGMSLKEGYNYRLGTFRPSTALLDMKPVTGNIIAEVDFPEFFVAWHEWPGWIHDPLDQRNCAASWAFSTASQLSTSFFISNEENDGDFQSIDDGERSDEDSMCSDSTYGRQQRETRERTINRIWTETLHTPFMKVANIILPKQFEQHDMLRLWGFVVDHINLPLPKKRLPDLRKFSQDKIWACLEKASRLLEKILSGLKVPDSEEQQAFAKALALRAIHRLLLRKKPRTSTRGFPDWLRELQLIKKFQKIRRAWEVLPDGQQSMIVEKIENTKKKVSKETVLEWFSIIISDLRHRLKIMKQKEESRLPGKALAVEEEADPVVRPKKTTPRARREKIGKDVPDHLEGCSALSAVSGVSATVPPPSTGEAQRRGEQTKKGEEGMENGVVGKERPETLSDISGSDLEKEAPNAVKKRTRWSDFMGIDADERVERQLWDKELGGAGGGDYLPPEVDTAFSGSSYLLRQQRAFAPRMGVISTNQKDRQEKLIRDLKEDQRMRLVMNEDVTSSYGHPLKHPLEKERQNKNQTYAGVTREGNSGNSGRRWLLGEERDWRARREEEEEEAYLDRIFENLSSERDPRQRYVARFRYKGEDPEREASQYISEKVLRDALGYRGEEAEDVVAVIQLLGSKETDVCLASELAYRNFWANCKRAKQQDPNLLKAYEVVPLFRSDTKVLTISFRTTTIPKEDVAQWVSKYATILSGPEKVRDTAGFWNGEYRCIVSFKNDDPQFRRGKIPKYFFLGADRGITRYSGQPAACFQCGSYEHQRRTCNTPLCSRCGARGHPSVACQASIRCNFCEEFGHTYFWCPKAFYNCQDAQRLEKANQVAKSGREKAREKEVRTQSRERGGQFQKVDREREKREEEGNKPKGTQRSTEIGGKPEGKEQTEKDEWSTVDKKKKGKVGRKSPQKGELYQKGGEVAQKNRFELLIKGEEKEAIGDGDQVPEKKEEKQAAVGVRESTEREITDQELLQESTVMEMDHQKSLEKKEKEGEVFEKESGEETRDGVEEMDTSEQGCSLIPKVSSQDSLIPEQLLVSYPLSPELPKPPDPCPLAPDPSFSSQPPFTPSSPPSISNTCKATPQENPEEVEVMHSEEQEIQSPELC